MPPAPDSRGVLATPSRSTRLRYRLRYRLNSYQPYLRLIEWKHRHRDDRFIRPDTELVIEGFGRSASSYAVTRLELAQPRPVKSAHHTHAGAQVVKAARLGLPTLVIVKRPDEVALSHMVRHPGLPAATVLRSWLRFHTAVAGVRDRVLVISVDELNGDYENAVRRLNARFGTAFVPPPQTPEFDAAVKEEMWKRHQRAGRPFLHFGSPTKERQDAKRALWHRLEDPAVAGIRAQAAALYTELTGRPAGVDPDDLPQPVAV
jgi:hypothetical protein